MRRVHILTILLAVTSLALTPTPTAVTTPTTPTTEGGARLPAEFSDLGETLNPAQLGSLTSNPVRLEWTVGWFRAFKAAIPDLRLEAMEEFTHPDESVMVVFSSDTMPDVVLVPPLGTWEEMKPPTGKVGTVEEVRAMPGVLVNRRTDKAFSGETGITEGSVLSQREGRLVYVDSEGCVVGKVDGKTGKWELAMRIDKEGYLHLKDYILRPHSTKQYAEGERIYHSPVINKIDIKYQEQLEALPKGSKYFEVTYDVLNGSKGLEEYWTLDTFHSVSTKISKQVESKWRIITSEDNEKTKDPIDFISIVSGAQGYPDSIDITKNGVCMVVYDEEDMKYLTLPVAE